ncbi:MAG: hypothetical protein US39_C0006G0043 [Microgenomates group bacterium GW2011_GWC1_37_12b]|uniref:Zinc-ribbon domain-containing protein n=1 Tax=Candidatus Woesebacteria bacterium GW2011_GWB1_38_8b TaxID=1618571 RepID=A0A0G0L5X3_9BACT|nr:MAG: hypothetical protein US39_C0006G0043 [Microgenomates group bacterium GW2011_GWC1_37_12b]KKQ87413.1 MAG: hypothetical protein UT10_C0007G0071 [Candidatus Woesebacteria bacterium GW2011_GWB1_38_8b]
MDEPVKCPTCHTDVRPGDYFCYNCGKNLKPKPPSTSLQQQIIVYLESIFLPPFGIFIGFRYLRQSDYKSKAVGIAAVVLTILSLVICTIITLDLLKTVNTQVNDQLQMLENF